MKIMVTGGAGFIGSALVRRLISHTDHEIVTIDRLTYAGNLDALASVIDDQRHHFERVDICDAHALERLWQTHTPDAVFHLAAESHVDRSIDKPADFIQSNIVGTYNLLETSLRYWRDLSEPRRSAFRFLHVSTDEVYGALTMSDEGFTESSPYRPTSPYSASKAASDHLVQAWHHTYDLPVLMSNCTNNFGPYQFPEKLIPLVINRALKGETIPIYGSGENIRDWIFVNDHVDALIKILESGEPGRQYNVSAGEEHDNLSIVRQICGELDTLVPSNSGASHAELIEFVADRPGHDLRYAMQAERLRRELRWAPARTFNEALSQTVRWYVDNQTWCEAVTAGVYAGERLGRR